MGEQRCKGARMSLVLVEQGMKEELDAMTARWGGIRFIGLFQNDLVIERTTTIDAIEPATFSGYVGLRPLMGWSAAVIRGDRAVTGAAPVNWVHNGGPLTNWIFGYYVVDPSGFLVWAERRPGSPIAMISAGQIYEVGPVFSQGSRFP
jgi:hypothetical protein